jgi:hypothetical protein
MKSCQALVVGLSAAMIFVGLATVRLVAQGLYYDELHQATAAFTYTGQGEQRFTSLTYRGIPLLNMRYSGAIKSAVYGLYLRWRAASFSVVSWRLVGVLAVAMALVVFCVLVGPANRFVAIFLTLLLTDATVLLATRHDWGPVALALALRLFFIGVWLRSEGREGAATPGPHRMAASSFVMGVIASFAAFEKLSSVVLVPVFGIVMAASPERRTLRCGLAALAGLALGSIPLIAVNWLSYLESGVLISLEQPAEAAIIKPAEWLRGMGIYLQLGSGIAVRNFILGRELWSWLAYLEAGLSLTLVALGAWFARSLRTGRLALVGVAAYLVIPALLFLLPQGVWVHHMILGTPFHYVAIAGVGALIFGDEDRARGGLRSALAVVLAFFLAVRVISLVSLELDLTRGAVSRAWDPSLTTAGQFLAAQEDALVIAASWGVATQVECFANGREGAAIIPSERFRTASVIQFVVSRSDQGTLYVARLRNKPEIRTIELWNDLDSVNRWLPGWREVAGDAALGPEAMVEIRKFVRDGKERDPPG